MQRIILIVIIAFFFNSLVAQSVQNRLTKAFEIFEKDSQMKNGIASLYVIDAKSGNIVFEKNSYTGLATASTMKIITSVSAYELLEKDFRYKTEFGYSGNIVDKILKGDIYIRPSGDPTLGSWRWAETKDETTISRIIAAVKKLDIKGYNSIVVNDSGWRYENIPDGWIWQDIGNYYGAGAGVLNWRENQFDIVLQSEDQIGSPVKIVETLPKDLSYKFLSVVTADAKGTGDNAYVYYPLNKNIGIIRGTIPVSEKRFTISAAFADPISEFTNLLQNSFLKAGIGQIKFQDSDKNKNEVKMFHTQTSPPLDSIIYWFNKRSINIYGEALVKTIGYQKKGIGSTEAGIELIKDFWKSKGISSTELNMVDGSGLSPLNRVTTHTQVRILQYAKNQNWFNGFYYSLPEFNNMKMKSGTIRDVKSFCGYHKSKSGAEYIFSFLVNNYNGSSSAIVQKMYKVLNELK
ncbi:MAG: D-alanyl-D-alanine carboxypeptidase/D-alanyl-D-alanine-endopeptidase [Chitinophagaceae bacterium]